MFANDLLLTMKSIIRNADAVKHLMMAIYCSQSSQNVDIVKSKLSIHIQCQISDILEVHPAVRPFAYLGVPLSSRRQRKLNFAFMIDKIHGKLNGWKWRFLS